MLRAHIAIFARLPIGSLDGMAQQRNLDDTDKNKLQSRLNFKLRKSEMTDTSLPAAAGLGPFERWLSVWVALAIGAGLLFGTLFAALFAFLASLEIASVNLPVAALIWAMVYPMMVGVDFGALHQVGGKPKGLVVNCLIKPFTMAALGVLFFNYVIAGLIPQDDAQAYLAGVILLGAAPCTAMVFVWSNLTRGDATYTLVQVSVNDRSWFSPSRPSRPSCWAFRISPCPETRCCCRWDSTSRCRCWQGI